MGYILMNLLYFSMYYKKKFPLGFRGPYSLSTLMEMDLLSIKWETFIEKGLEKKLFTLDE